MLLKVRHRGTIYGLIVPRGSRVLASQRGRLVLMMPARHPEDTGMWLAGISILRAAAAGEHGIHPAPGTVLPTELLNPGTAVPQPSGPAATHGLRP